MRGAVLLEPGKLGNKNLSKGLLLGKRKKTTAAFTPASIAGLQAWYKADAGTLDGSGNPATDGVAVKTWQDQSGNGLHAVQTTAGRQPALKTGIANGLSILRFDDGDLFDIAGVVIAQPSTIFLVAKPNASGGRNAFDGITTRQAILTNGTPNWAYYAGGGVVASAVAADSTKFHVVVGNFNGASSKLYLNGTQIATGNPGTASLNGLRIGAFQADNGEWNSDIAELLCYSGTLSTTDRQAVEAYLKAKWGTP